jgi:hypothetical protein
MARGGQKLELVVKGGTRAAIAAAGAGGATAVEPLDRNRSAV